MASRRRRTAVALSELVALRMFHRSQQPKAARPGRWVNAAV
jgi:hypothetical protein